MTQRKIFLTIISVFLFANFANAQGLGVQAGYVQSITRAKISTDEKMSRQPKLSGFKVGVFYEHDFYKGLGMSYGLNYSFLHDKTPWGQPNNYGITNSEKTQVQYFDVPLAFQYKLLIAQELFLIFNVGPTFSYGLSNDTEKIEKNIINEEVHEIDNYADKYQRFDVLLGGNIGLQYKNYQLRGGYDFGLLNLYASEYISTDAASYTRLAYRNEWNIKLIYNF